MSPLSRRSFIKKAGLATAGAIVAPYILPSGRLFAASGTRIANHVVFVLFAGGIRHQESIGQSFLSGQGGAYNSYTGNLMENMLNGSEPSSTGGVYTRWQPLLGNTLESQGFLYKEMRYNEGPTGHYNGHTAAITGNYTNSSLDLNINPEHPTVFEYYRKHSDPAVSAKKCWWMSEGLGPYPSLNYSHHGLYGPSYGANYLRPMSTFNTPGPDVIGNGINFQPDDVYKIRNVKQFLDANFGLTASDLPGIINTVEDKDQIETFIKQTLQASQSGAIEYPVPPGLVGINLLNAMNGDLWNIAYAWQVMKTFTPELLVINTFNSDICHNNFGQYVQNLHKADYGVGWLWNKIQSTPGLQDDTIMICMPDHGRNLSPNNITDPNFGLKAYDHTSDDNSRRTFALVVGPPDKVNQGQNIGNSSTPHGESIDVVPTIATILGFKDQIPAGMLFGSHLQEAFV